MRVALVLGIAALGLGCADETTAPANGPTVRASTLAGGAQVVKGEIGPEALYALYLPENWNGDLVLYSHAYGSSTDPKSFPDEWGFDCSVPGPLVLQCMGVVRDSLLAAGYGWAWSTWSYGGLALEDAQVRTAQLRALFTASFGRPQRTYLYTHSLGGAVVMELAQRTEQRFDGALSVCGIVGGVPHQLDYYFTVRALFDYFFPGVLPGNAISNPDGLDFGAVIGAIAANPAAAMELAAVDQVMMEYADFGDLVQAILMPLYFNAWDSFTNDILRETHGRNFFDNRTVRYTGSSDDDALNAGVTRYEAAPDAVDMVAHLYTPSGKLGIPVLTLHTRRDPIAPISHETVLSAAVAAQGASDMLVTRILDRAGHCTTTMAEELGAFRDLAAWVETGVKPAS